MIGSPKSISAYSLASWERTRGYSFLAVPRELYHILVVMGYLPTGFSHPVFKGCRAPQSQGRFTSDIVVPAKRTVLASRLQVGHAGMSLPHHAVRRSDPFLRRPIEDNHENLRDG